MPDELGRHSAPPLNRATQWHAAVALGTCLQLVDLHDRDYPKRYTLVLMAMALACDAGYPTGIRIDPAEPNWPVVYIELPTGQVSWHMPEHTSEWDGHTVQDKLNRVRAYVASVGAPQPSNGEENSDGKSAH